MAKKKVLVTGSNGFLGGYVLGELVENGYEVRATDLPRSDHSFARELGVEFLPSDLLDFDSLLTAVKGVDAVIHLGGVFRIGGERRLLFDVNVRGTENMCRAALIEGVGRFVHFSTVAIYDHPGGLPIDEGSAKYPHDSYGMTKWWGEKAAHLCYQEKGLPVVRLRPTVAYGPRGKYIASMIFAGGMIPRFHGMNKLHVFSGGLHTSWVHAEDIAGAAVFLLEPEEAVGKAYNIVDDTPMPAGDVLKKMLELYGLEVVQSARYIPWLAGPMIKLLSKTPAFVDRFINRRVQSVWDKVVLEYDLLPALEPAFNRNFMLFFAKDFVVSNQRIKDLGYRLRHPDFSLGFDETARWYRERKWIPDLS